ncbi:hydrolase, partial [Streptomyces albidoflavus]
MSDSQPQPSPSPGSPGSPGGPGGADVLLTGATLTDGRTVDVRLGRGRIQA